MAAENPDRFGEKGDRLRRAIMALPKFERLVITLYYFEEVEDDASIARILDLDVATARLLRERAIRRIHDAMK